MDGGVGAPKIPKISLSVPLVVYRAHHLCKIYILFLEFILFHEICSFAQVINTICRTRLMVLDIYRLDS